MRNIRLAYYWVTAALVAAAYLQAAKHGSLFIVVILGATGPFLYLGARRVGLMGPGPAQPGLLDVNETERWLADLKAPFQYELRDPVFLGATPTGSGLKPVTIKAEVFAKNHVSILGASGTGKSKLAALLLTQLNDTGSAVVVVDPKDDEFLPSILNQQALERGVPFVYVNLRSSTPQVNPFNGATEEQREALLQAALNLDPAGDPAVDFYRGEDRDACMLAIRTGATNLVDLVHACAQLDQVTERQNFWRELQQLARVQALATDGGPDIAAAIEAGGVVYVVGDTDDLNVRAAQRMLLARVLQIIKARERQSARQTVLFLDEFKYLISNIALRALGTIRDRKCNLCLAYQSYADLSDCGTLNPTAVLGAAKENTTLKFVYKLEDAETARQFSVLAGEKRVLVESTNKLLDEGREAGALREANVPAVTVDMLTTNLPKPLAGEASVCWVFGLGPAFPLATMHLPAGPAPQVQPAPPVAKNSVLPTAQDLI